MIGEPQKRKPSPKEATGGSSSLQRQKSQSSKKRAKLGQATKQLLATPSSVGGSKSRAARAANVKSNGASQQHLDANCSASSDESVWIFGLINNIEQLLTTFTAINSAGSTTATGATSAASGKRDRQHHDSNRQLQQSGSSTPCSLASFSAASSPGQSSCQSSPSRPSTANQQQHQVQQDFSQQQQVASSVSQQQSRQVASPLPRSPISRQIKFHEYKGPPSAKRQQQQPQQQAQQQSRQRLAARQQQQQTSSSLAQQQQLQQPIDDSEPVANSVSVTTISTSTTSPAVAANAAASTTTARPSDAKARSLQAPEQQLASFDPNSSLAQQQQLLTQLQQPPQTQQQRSTAISHAGRAGSQSLQPANVTQTHMLQQQQALAPRRLVASQVTSWPQCNGIQWQQFHLQATQHQAPQQLQTFYINQNTAESSDANGPTVLLAPFADTEPTRHNVREHQHHHQLERLEQPQQQIRPQLQLMQQKWASGAFVKAQPHIGCEPTAGSEYQSQCRETAAAGQLILAPSSSSSTAVASVVQPLVQEQQWLDQQQLEPLQSRFANHIGYQQPQYQLARSQADLILDGFAGYSAEASESAAAGVGTYLESQRPSGADVELTSSFGPDGPTTCGNTTDACELEPSIGFGHGVDELLFSEFIDLQDVPMNVDESDWLKKFLPPCSMS